MGKMCKVCEQFVVHPARKWNVCLDCLIDHLIKNGVKIPEHWNVNYHEGICACCKKSIANVVCRYCGKFYCKRCLIKFDKCGALDNFRETKKKAKRQVTPRSRHDVEE